MRVLADENFNGQIVRGLLRRCPDLDLVQVEQVGLAAADDPVVLEWAAAQNRIVLSHDVQTLPGFAYERVRSGLRMTGVVEVPQWLGIGRAIDDILLIVAASTSTGWENQVIFLPL